MSNKELPVGVREAADQLTREEFEEKYKDSNYII